MNIDSNAADTRVNHHLRSKCLRLVFWASRLRIRLVNSHNRLWDSDRAFRQPASARGGRGVTQSTARPSKEDQHCWYTLRSSEDLLTSSTSVPFLRFLDRTAAVFACDASEVVRSTRRSTTVSENDGSMEVISGSHLESLWMDQSVWEIPLNREKNLRPILLATA